MGLQTSQDQKIHTSTLRYILSNIKVYEKLKIASFHFLFNTCRSLETLDNLFQVTEEIGRNDRVWTQVCLFPELCLLSSRLDAYFLKATGYFTIHLLEMSLSHISIHNTPPCADGYLE